MWVALAILMSYIAHRYASTGVNPDIGAGKQQAERIVSLAPTITEVLFELGAGDRVVGRTDYCDYPAGVQGLPAAGSGISPNYEVLVGLNPDMILTEGSGAAQVGQLMAIAPTHRLEWLTLEKALNSLSNIGRLLKLEDEAGVLAARMRVALGVPSPSTGPRVLMLLGPPVDGAELWFVKRNSLHGRVMHAAGMRNAVAEEIPGAPSMSYERLVEVNPEVIVVMLAKDEISGPERAAGLELLRRFPMLAAVRSDAVHFLPGKGYFNNGPRLLELVEVLKALSRQPKAEGVAP